MFHNLNILIMKNPLIQQQELNAATTPDPLSSRPVQSTPTKLIAANEKQEELEELKPFVHFY